MRLTDGAEVSREVERHGDAAAVLPYDAKRRSALVVRHFRAPVLVASGEEMSEEACAGMIENKDADTTARREAYEDNEQDRRRPWTFVPMRHLVIFVIRCLFVAYIPSVSTIDPVSKTRRHKTSATTSFSR
jgi:hypothetical protein